MRLMAVAIQILVCTVGGLAAAARGQAPDKQALAVQVKGIFTKNCYRCHGQDGSGEGGFDCVLDFKKLVGTEVIAGNPKKSKLFRKLASGEMPPESEPGPSDAEIAIVEKWIALGAPAPPAKEPKPDPPKAQPAKERQKP